MELTSPDELRDVEPLGVGPDVVHESVWLIFGVEDTEIGVNTVVGPLVAHTLLKELGELLVVAELLVVLDEVLEVVGLDYDVESTSGGGGELLGSDAGEADCLPDLWDVGLFGGLEGLDVLLQHDEDLGELLVVANSLE